MERRPHRISRTFALLGMITLVAGLPSPAVATTDLFRFSASQNGFHFSLEMVGSTDPGYVQASSSDYKVFMPRRDYYVEFNRPQKRAYVRPKARDGLPWFEMDVVGEHGTLHYNGRRIEGTAEWGPW